MDLSVIIPAREEEFLPNTIDSVLENMRGDTEVITILDGYWPDNGIPQHPRLTLVHYEESIGQRAGVNEGARISRAKFIMKLDAHCMVDKGFDVKLMKHCEHDWTVIPRMFSLHVFNWKCTKCGHEAYQGKYPDHCVRSNWKCGKCEYAWFKETGPTRCGKCGAVEGFIKLDGCDNIDKFEKILVWKRRRNRKSDYWRFDKNMKFDYWSGYKHRPEAKHDIVDVMSSIGACFFMHRERFWELGGMDEQHGSWGMFGTEVACKSWLSGGRHVVNKKTWFAHMFRTHKGFAFPYDLKGRQVDNARKYSKDLWLNDKWPLATRKLEWLIDKFKPIPDWHPDPPNGVPSSGPSISPKSNISYGLVYYTDNHGDPFLLETCRKQIHKCMEDYNFPIVSVSQKPIDFGKNIVMDLERAVLSIFKQILKGVEESDSDFIFLLEHDLLYHPSHFDFDIHFNWAYPKKDVFYYDRNRWSVCDETGKAVFYHTNVPSMLCASRELLIKHYSKCVEWVERDGWKGRYGYSPPKGVPKEQREGSYKTYFSEFPSLDIRRKDSWSRKRMDKSQFRSERSCRGWKEADEVPGWGKIKGRFNEFVRQIELVSIKK